MRLLAQHIAQGAGFVYRHALVERAEGDVFRPVDAGQELADVLHRTCEPAALFILKHLSVFDKLRATAAGGGDHGIHFQGRECGEILSGQPAGLFGKAIVHMQCPAAHLRAWHMHAIAAGVEQPDRRIQRHRVHYFRDAAGEQRHLATFSCRGE